MVIPMAFPDSLREIEADEYISIDFRGLSIFSDVYFQTCYFGQWSPSGPRDICGISEILGRLLFMDMLVSIFSWMIHGSLPK
jgi:hypothetical protein